jgi:hypothetical protein
MSGRYLTDLANVCRGAGLVVQEEPGWQTRARGSGGYSSGRPTHIMCHHTASNAGSDGQADVNYMCYGSGDAPIANLYLARSGKVWVMAAGATNTNGSGGPLDNVPADSMNTHAIGIEAANNGVGEPWAKAQTDAYQALTRALMSAYGIPLGHVRSHWEWTTRKIDPAGQSPWASGSNSWNMDGYRSSVGSGPEPTPPTPEEEDDMPNPYVLKNSRTGAAIVVESDGLRSIGGAELNYLSATKRYDVVSVPDGDEWQMALASRTSSVNVVND